MRANLAAAIDVRFGSQLAFARAVGLHSVRVNRLCRGWVEPTPVERERIAETLRADSDWLFAVLLIPNERGVQEMKTEEVGLVHVFAVEYVVHQLRGEFGEPKEEFGSAIQRPTQKIAASTQEEAVAYVKGEEAGFSVTVTHVATILQNVLIKKRTAVAA